MIRCHAMPFGAEVTSEGVRFRLWAPAAQDVALSIGKHLIPMPKVDAGWFELLHSAKPGTLYRYCINGEHFVPDPASRFQPKDAEGPSEVIDPAAFKWKDGKWKRRPWHEAVLYELHVGSFSKEGTYDGVRKKLDHLKKTRITAIELMPLSDFSGKRNWGYDGVLAYAPDSRYGRPEDLKALVQAAHAAGLMVFLDVVYNHFGPKGNFLHQYAPQFFTDRYQTPWGAAIDFESRWVREYFVHNARYWIDEYHFDGLRFDAVHAIFDDSPRHILDEIRQAIAPEIHLVLENDANQARFIGPGKYTAQWNDDSHHAYHLLATGEKDGYYLDYADAPAKHLARCLAEGFAYQGDFSAFRQKPRGARSAHLPATSFVDFLQNHDQIGNRAFGERLICLTDEKILKALAAIFLLAPSPPLLFMGEEWGCRQPFLFFCDFPGDLGEAVRKGRREEFARFAAFEDPAARERIPDPLAPRTFKACVLDWQKRDKGWLAFYQKLLALRRRHVVPRLRDIKGGRYRMLGERAFEVAWDDLVLTANCGSAPLSVERPSGRVIWSSTKTAGEPWSVHWWLKT
ncbi:MAG: malto-oligosyltrehalose trehalohydrolase [Betaproteobacteria bacterium 13_1_20CM_3_63_8]|nr:MAG: malto-oligosyltrehalose trehalohydrolase [Betaproteobacteria bacterium 13_1_20CM_3_63_8]